MSICKDLLQTEIPDHGGQLWSGHVGGRGDSSWWPNVARYCWAQVIIWTEENRGMQLKSSFVQRGQAFPDKLIVWACSWIAFLNLEFWVYLGKIRYT